MADFTSSKPEQKHRLLHIELPCDDKQYSLLLRVKGLEELSMPYHYELDVVTANTQLTAGDIMGKAVSFNMYDIHSPNSNTIARNFHGIITSFTTGEECTYNKNQQELSCRMYFLSVSPILWLLQKSRRNRVFQKTGQTILDIVKTVLEPYKIDLDTSKVKQPMAWEYCTQYNETDFDFFQRIVATAGIYYYFNQEPEKHTLILANNTSAYLSPAIELTSQRDTDKAPYIQSLKQYYQLYTGSFTFCNTTIKQGNTALRAQKKVLNPYHFPSNTNNTVFFNFPAQMSTKQEGEQLATFSENQAITESYKCIGDSNHCQLQAGSNIKFTSRSYEQMQDKDQVIIWLSFDVADTYSFAEISSNDFFYQNKWRSISSKICFRSQPPDKPNPGHFQLATVVNAQGEVNDKQIINCDEYGQHTIKFIWEDSPDNQNKTNKFDKCRVRVLNKWDNGIYRVGTPVVVGFMDGDIDKPIILGSTNDANNLLLGQYDNNNNCTSVLKRYPAIENQNKCNYNSITFNDKKDKEKLSIHAGKDMHVNVTNSRNIIIASSPDADDKNNNDTYQLEKGNRKTHIKKGNLSTTISDGNELHEIKNGERKVIVQKTEVHNNKSNYKHEVDKNYSLKVSGKLVIEAKGGIELISGSSSIKINGANISIKSSNVTIN